MVEKQLDCKTAHPGSIPDMAS
jgi:MFS family permease